MESYLEICVKLFLYCLRIFLCVTRKIELITDSWNRQPAVGVFLLLTVYRHLQHRLPNFIGTKNYRWPFVGNMIYRPIYWHTLWARFLICFRRNIVVGKLYRCITGEWIVIDNNDRQRHRRQCVPLITRTDESYQRHQGCQQNIKKINLKVIFVGSSVLRL